MANDEKYQEIIENANEAIFLEQNDLLVFANEKTREIFDIDNSELDNISLRDFISPEMDGSAMPSQRTGNQGGEYLSIQIETVSGVYKWVELHRMPLTWEGNPATLYFGRDITQQKALENRLQIAQKMEAIGTLAGGIAHDFNNILSPIIGYTELTLEEVDQESLVYKNLSQVYKAANRARDLVQQILMFSRQSDVASKPVKVHLIAHEALKLLRASIPSNIDFKIDIDDTCQPVIADQTQIHQIILNLCSNAYHAMYRMNGVLSISVKEIQLTTDKVTNFVTIPADTYVQIKVSDTGHGMDPTLIQRIFEPFFTTKEKGLGTGMGLSVVHGIVRDHKGFIEVQSDPGKQTTFSVYLPVIKTEDIKSELGHTENIPGGNEHIFLVDDEKDIVFMVKQMLEGLGYEVTTRTSSIEALQAFENQPDKYDLIITDQIMPNLSGDLLARQIKQIRPELPILLCTGFSEYYDKEKLAVNGITDIVFKPVLKIDLAKAIRKAIGNTAKTPS